MALCSIKTRNRIGLAALGAGFLVIPCARGTAQEPVRRFEEVSQSALTLRDSIVAIARAQVGRRYLPGGATPKRGFDCSGLVKYVLQSMHVDVPRTAIAQARIGSRIPRDTNALRPGDLLMFGKPKDGVSHVGIYVGHGRYVHASSVAGRVIESPLNRPPSALVKVLKSVRRVLAVRESPPGRILSGSAEASGMPTPVAIKQRQ